MKRQLILAGVLVVSPCRAVYASPEDDAVKASALPSGFFNLGQPDSRVFIKFNPASTATATPSPEPTPSPTATATPSPRPTRRPTATATPTSTPTTAAVACKDIRIEWVSIPDGRFLMGSDDQENFYNEKPVHEVSIKGFKMAKTEVTVEQYKACVDVRNADPEKKKGCSEPSTIGGCNWNVPGRERHPINCVDWNQAIEFAKCVGARLPAEAEWEYAARAGTTGERYGDLDTTAWYAVNSGGHTHEVGGKKPNAWGLYDMAGNVYEWTQDLYHDSYVGAPTDGSAWESPAGSSSRIVRGGSWNVYARDARFLDRYGDNPGGRYPFAGFRPVL